MRSSKSKRVEILLNEEEQRAVEEKCRQTGLTMGQLAKRCLLDQKVEQSAALQQVVHWAVDFRQEIAISEQDREEKEKWLGEVDRLCRLCE